MQDWQSALNKHNWKNPIKEGQRYLEYLNSNPGVKYRDVAEEFGVSRSRVCQMIALTRFGCGCDLDEVSQVGKAG